MNWDTVKGDWQNFKGKVKEQWGKLTDDDLTKIEGKREQLAGTIQKRYGIEKDEANRQVKAFEDKCGECEHERHAGSHEKHSDQGMTNPAKSKSQPIAAHPKTDKEMAPDDMKSSVGAKPRAESHRTHK